MSYTTSTADLRRILSDGDTDKLRWRKRCIGATDGVNTRFKTFEFRRLTDFSTSTSPQIVYVNGAAVAVTSDSPSVGEVILTVAPAQSDVVEATYYIQWFIDDELNEFLTLGVNWLGLGSDVTTMAEGLRPALLKYASHEAYNKLSLRFAEHLSETYRLEDASDDQMMKVVDAYKTAADSNLKQAILLRDDFYKRQGQPLAPNFGINAGRVFDVPPRF